MTEKPLPPDLQARGQAFWRAVDAGWVLSVDERELLIEACRTIDACETLQAVINREGVLSSGSAGQVRVHPAVGELRSSRLALARLIAALGLPDQAGASVPSPTTVRARRAARARWGSNAS